MASTTVHTWKTPVPGQRADTAVEVMVKVVVAARAAAMATTKTTAATAMVGVGVTQQSTE